MSVIAELVCNGPSIRNGLPPKTNFRVGCNLPPCEVDIIVVCDAPIIEIYNKMEKIPTSKFFLVGDAARKEKELEVGLDVVKRHLEKVSYFSSGHWGAKYLIELGYTSIDVYGCDSMIHKTSKSITHDLIGYKFKKESPVHVEEWKKNWERLQVSNPDVSITFHDISNSSPERDQMSSE